MKSICRFSFRRLISFVPVLFLLAVFITFGGSALYADTFTVENWDDSGPGSLRAAIASADSYDDVISFDVTGIITLSSQLKINNGMKIQGPGADLLAVSGGGACRVFYVEDTAESVDISGISIVSGHVDDYEGGGVYNNSSKLTLTNCVFSGNSAQSGGGLHNEGSSPTVTNCTFTLNTANIFAGGMFNWASSCPTVTNCTFYLNSAHNGGGMYNHHSDPKVSNCTFSSNSAEYRGGGMYIWSYDYLHTTVTNCTFSSNSAEYGGDGMYNEDGNPKLTNCIFWDGGNEISGSSSTLSYCIVQSYDQGVSTVTSADPMLQALADNDGPTWTCALELGSSAIDAGTTVDYVNMDQRGVIRPQGTRFDIGAYELKSYLLTTICNNGGYIIPESADVFEGESMDIYIFPDSGYEIYGVYLDGDPVSYDKADCYFTFQNLPSDDHILMVVFEPNGDDDDDDIPNDDDDVDDSTSDDDGNDDVNGGGGGGGCNISVLSGIGLLLLVPMMFLSKKMK